MRQPQILVIDDDPLFRSLLVSVLRKDFIVSVAAEGSEGLYKASENPPAVAIIDVNMPGWDGLQTLRAFRRNPRTSRCRVMMLTGDATRETVVAAVEAGADDYVIKSSFTRPELRKKLEELIAAGPFVPDAEPPDAPFRETVTEEDLQAALDAWS